MSTVLVIHAHPDDEVFATGGLMSALARRGHRVLAIIASGGESGELRSDDPEPLTSARERRIRSYSRSIAILGAAAWDWLDEPGRWIDGDPAVFPTIADEDPEVLAAAVGACLAKHRPDLVVTVGTDGLTGHPDHAAVSRAVTRAVEERRAPEWGVWGAQLRAVDVVSAHALLRTESGAVDVGTGRVTGTDAPLRKLEVAASTDARRRALDCYRPGLGTVPLAELVARSPRHSDSLLLRALFDATGWRREYYVGLVGNRV